MNEHQVKEPPKKKFIIGTVSEVVIAALTLFNITLAFWPPFKTADLKVDFEDEIFISQSFGTLVVYQGVYLKNFGSKRGFVNKFEIEISGKNSSFKRILVARNTYNQSNGVTDPLKEIVVFPENYWSLNLVFHEHWDDELYRASFNFNNAVADQIDSLSRKNYLYVAKLQLDSLKHESLKRIINFIPGEYDYIIKVWSSEREHPILIKKYSFSVSKESISDLYNLTLRQHEISRGASYRSRSFHVFLKNPKEL